ncbi:MAG: chondroitin lyase [Humisphaera sp.]|nr:chondroitin lyase [Humisphaera sp.]
MPGMILPLLASMFLLLAPASPTENDMNTVRTRLIRSVISNDPAAVAALKADAARHAASLRPDHSWADIEYGDDRRTYWSTQEHARRVLAMSKGVRLSIDAGALDKALLEKTHAALDYWLEKDFQNPNWWHNQIGTPELIGESAVLLQPNLSAQQTEKMLEIMRRSDWKKWTGQNLVWGCANQVMRGLIENDSQVVAAAYARMYNEVHVTTAEGIQPDWSFHQHGAQFYSGGYGLQFAQDVPRYSACAFGTRWQMPADKMEFFNGFMLDGQRWMMHRHVFDYAAVGREITRQGKSAAPRDWTGGPISPRGAAYSLLNAVNLLAANPIPRQQEYRDWATTIGDGSIERPLVGNRHYWRSDYMAHHRPAWFASVRMFSDRLLNTELVNNEGKLSHHLADGANFLYVTGDEYTDIFPAWDWTKIPGTTAEQTPLTPGDRKQIGIKGATSFVGGVSDGTNGLAAMDLRRDPLRARKSWFFFDDGYTCLGAGIACESDNAVATSVNQCHLRGEVKRQDNWIHHADVGYVFPDRSKVLTTAKQSGDWSDIGAHAGRVSAKVFNLWIDHGARPAEASYVYSVFPTATPQRTAELAAKPEVQVILNTPKQQAVYHERLKVLSVAFWETGKVQAGKNVVEVDQPCLLMLSDEGVATVSNPANQPLVVNVRVNGKSLSAELPGGDRAGSSVQLR